MRVVPDHLTEVWGSSDKTGDDRKPVVRATIQKAYLRRWSYDTADSYGGTHDTVDDPHRIGSWTSIIFGNPHPIRELRSIKSCSWNRSIDQDVATCTLTLLNVDLTPIGNPDEADQAGFDQPGYFTFSRGRDDVSEDRWGYGDNGWTNVIMPDALVKTYEGYGIDRSVSAGQDENLVQTGVWLVDKVTYNSDGTISLEMRDIGRLLLEQIAFPPVIPTSEYPMAWEHIHGEQVPGRDVTGAKLKQLRGIATARSSNDYYIGKGIVNGNVQYVDSRGGVYGHKASDALTNTKVWADYKKHIGTRHWWQSTGQKHQEDFVWWQADLKDHTTAINGLRIQSAGSAYMYISLKGKNGWIGRKKIPYDPNGDVVPDKYGNPIDIEADIPFVMKVRAEPSRPFDVILPRKYSDIRAIRITITYLYEKSPHKPYSFHGILRDLQIYTAPNVNQLGFKKGTVLKTVGNYADYVSIVWQALAWCGWYHPDRASGDDWIKIDGDPGPHEQHTVHFRKGAKAIGAYGGLWAVGQATHTYGIADLTPDLFDKKPIMDMINYVRDLTGFNFHIDEAGAAVFRMMNIWSLGNWLDASPLEQRHVDDDVGVFSHKRVSTVIEFDEDNSLFEYNTVLSSEGVRERIFVANSTGGVGTVIKGYNPNPTNMRRVAGWTDQHFATKRETVVMADMLAARAMFDYRRGHLKTAGYPAVQIDDQVRIWERVTNETYYHHVLSIQSTNDMDAGTWDYDIETHWLGEKPEDAWVVKVDELKDATKAYLKLLK